MNNIERLWPDFYEEGIKLTNGETLMNRFGKYQPNLTFILTEETASSVEWMDPKAIGVDLNITFDGSDVVMLPGEYWVSKKGTHCFRPKKDGSHVLVRVDWGGCFEHSRGDEYDQIKELALYSRRASSNGGGSGYNYYVFMKDYHRDISIEDI